MAVFPPPPPRPSSHHLSSTSFSSSCSSCWPAGRWVGVDAAERQCGGCWFHSLTSAAASRRALGVATSPRARESEREERGRGRSEVSIRHLHLLAGCASLALLLGEPADGWGQVGLAWVHGALQDGGRGSRAVVVALKLNTTDMRNFLLSMFQTASVGKTF